MLANKEHTRFYVSNLATTTAVASGTLEDLTTGQIALVTLAGAVINTANSGSYDTLDKIIAAYPTGVRLAVCEADGVVRLSDVIIPGNITSCRVKGYTSPTSKVSFIGYDGVSATKAMDALSSTNFIIRLLLQSSSKFSGDYPLWKEGVYASGSVASTYTQSAVATGLLKSLNANFSREKADGEQFIKFDRVASGTVAAITGSSTICKFTEGSKTVSVYIKAASGTTTLTASTASVTDATVLNIPSTNGRTFTFSAVALGTTAGRHVIYIGSTAYNVSDAGTDAQNATAIAVAINAGTLATASVGTAVVTITYLPSTVGSLPPMVLSSDDDSTFSEVAVTIASGDAVPTKVILVGTTSTAATFTLDVPYEGKTSYTFDGTTAATNSGIGTVTNWGIKLTGVPRKYILGAFLYQKADWTINLDSSFVTATVTESVAANKGSGFYQEVEELEWQLQQNNMLAGRNTVPPIVYKHNVSNTVLYDLTVVSFYEQSSHNIVSNDPKSYKKIMLATNSASATRTGLGLASTPLALIAALGGTTAQTSL